MAYRNDRCVANGIKYVVVFLAHRGLSAVIRLILGDVYANSRTPPYKEKKRLTPEWTYLDANPADRSVYVGKS